MFRVAATEEAVKQRAELVSSGEKNVGVTFIGTGAVAHLKVCKSRGVRLRGRRSRSRGVEVSARE